MTPNSVYLYPKNYISFLFEFPHVKRRRRSVLEISSDLLEFRHKFRCPDNQSNSVDIFFVVAVEQNGHLNNGVFHGNVWHIAWERSMKSIIRVGLAESFGYFQHLQSVAAHFQHPIPMEYRCCKFNNSFSLSLVLIRNSKKMK